MKRLIAILLVLFIACLVGCSDIKNYFEKVIYEREMAQAEVEDFLFLLGNDIVAAKEYLHPNFYADKGGFDAFVEDFEKEYNISILDGIAIIEEMGSSSGNVAYLTDDYTYSKIEFSYRLVIGVKPMRIYIQIREDEYGRGIYKFEKYKDQMD